MKSIKEWRAEQQNEYLAQSATPQQQAPQVAPQQQGMPFKASAVAGAGSRGKSGMGAVVNALQQIAVNNPNLGRKISNLIWQDTEISQEEKDQILGAFRNASSFNAAWQTGARGINSRQG